MADDQSDTPFEVRKLLRAARSGMLATLGSQMGADGGQPFASLVTPACAPDLSLLLLLSDLSEHTRHLRAEPRCSILVCGTAEDANPQTTPRVTVTGVAEIVDDAVLKAGRFRTGKVLPRHLLPVCAKNMVPRQTKAANALVSRLACLTAISASTFTASSCVKMPF